MYGSSEETSKKKIRWFYSFFFFHLSEAFKSDGLLWITNVFGLLLSLTLMIKTWQLSWKQELSLWKLEYIVNHTDTHMFSSWTVEHCQSERNVNPRSCTPIPTFHVQMASYFNIQWLNPGSFFLCLYQFPLKWRI